MPRILKPQEGKQTDFVACDADICIYGGSAGGGKSYGLLLIPLRYKNVPGFNCTIFRKNFNQIFAQGGLWDTATDMYTGIKGAVQKKGEAAWEFQDKSGNRQGKISFAHIERYEDTASWQGSQICYICFDELCHFGERTFFYMLSRNRSSCGVKPAIRATCNPDSDSWVAKFIEWWIDHDTGYAIPERSGIIRWMIRREGTVYWADTKEELWKKFRLETPEERDEPKSVTFIASSIYDNKILLKNDPSYLANLKALPELEREQLLKGNWKIKPSAGLYFRRTQVELIENVPQCVQYCRAWDMAATSDKESKEADYTAGTLMGKTKQGRWVVIDVINKRISAGEVEKYILLTSQMDRQKYGTRYIIHLEQEGGSAGKILAGHFTQLLAGFDVRTERASGDKQTRAMPFSAQWQNGNVDVVMADWNDAFFEQLESFPESKHDDMVDSAAYAFTELCKTKFNIGNLI